MLGKIKKIHFVGIGGIGMSGMAKLLFNIGYEVSGSDLIDSSITNHLKSLGISISIGHAAKNVSDCDLVVYS